MRYSFVFLAILGSATSLQAQPGQEQEPQRAADLALIEQRMQAAYEKISPAVVRITRIAARP